VGRSPVHLLYAQEARQYALWSLVTVLATWALRRAVRLHHWRAWGLYAGCLSLTFYTSVLSLFIVLAHGVYGLLALSRQQWRKLAIAIAAAGGLFSPWLLVMWRESRGVAISYRLDHRRELSHRRHEQTLGITLCIAVFIDPNLPLEHPYSWLVPPVLLLLLLGILLSLFKDLPKESSVLLLALVLVPTAALIGGDGVRGSVLSSHTRYFMPALAGTLVAVAGWLGLQYRHRRQASHRDGGATVRHRVYEFVGHCPGTELVEQRL
jgi:uncharacterized membrane protein